MSKIAVRVPVTPNMLEQQLRAAEIIAAYEAEALRLGCTIYLDSITCHTVEQAKALDDFWKKLTS